MRYRLGLSVFLALYCCALPVAYGEQASNIRLLAKDSKILAYVMGDPARSNLISIGKKMDKAIGIECAEEYRLELRPALIVIIEPIDLPDGAPHPLTGAWQYRFNVTRCNATKTYNAFAMTQTGSAPKFGALIPGRTLASPVLVRDTYQSVVMKVALDEKLKRKRECNDIIVKDTRVTVPPQLAEKANGPAISGRYEEEWMLRSCGEEVAVPICFIPKADGGTSFRLQLCKEFS